MRGAPATAGVGPSIKRPGDVATVSIGENDVAGGVIQFDVVKVRYMYIVISYLGVFEIAQLDMLV
jgi:hypothetical protein